ncbi:MAG TPA: PEP-CTERM sorting domain-containing protein [Rhizomicrobium sp.]|nr:PEP-CTERM sorting domain-containing protein [Rhizomicrobium sp.]
MIKYTLSTAALALLAGLSMGSANAALISANASVGGAPTGVTLDNLDAIALGAGGGTSATGIIISFTGDGGAVTGNLTGIYAAPVLSGGNGVGFGNPSGDQASGPDLTHYLTAGGTSVASATLILPIDVKYFGLLWGSVDDFNSLELWNGDVLVGIVTGTDVTPDPTGAQTADGTYYVNITSDTIFNKVVAKSTDHAFEFDNIAYNPTDPTIPSPEPLTLSLFGAGLAGMGLVRRRRRRTA